MQTSPYDASQGRNAGGNVEALTKSGQNNFHGNAYYFLRNKALNAYDFFLNAAGRPRPELSRHQFGGTLGDFELTIASPEAPSVPPTPSPGE